MYMSRKRAALLGRILQGYWQGFFIASHPNYCHDCQKFDDGIGCAVHAPDITSARLIQAECKKVIDQTR